MKITAAIFALLPAATQAAFKQTPGNADEYDNGEENAAGLKTALDKEKEDSKAAKERLTAFEAAESAKIEAARKKAVEEARSTGDFATIEKDYQAKMKALEEKVAAADNQRNADMTNAAIDAAANELAKDFVSPSLALPAIKQRLKAEIVDGKAIVRVLDKTGNASASGITELRNEFLTTPELKASLIASKGGGGGSEHSPGGGGSESGAGEKGFNPVTAKAKDLVAHIKATNPNIGQGND